MATRRAEAPGAAYMDEWLAFARDMLAAVEARPSPSEERVARWRRRVELLESRKPFACYRRNLFGYTPASGQPDDLVWVEPDGTISEME